MKKVFIVVLLLLAILVMSFKDQKSPQASSVNEPPSYKPIVVLELYTSQGCSSCPSADELLQKVKREYKNEVYALSYHVDYWNYIGWKDPFSKAQYADKQREYNIKFKNKSNYTPQLVVNGKSHFVGSHTKKMYSEINENKDLKVANEVFLSKVSVKSNAVSFDYKLLGETDQKQVRAMLVIDERTTKVSRGENRNRTLTNSNIVVQEQTFKAMPKETMTIKIPDLVQAKDQLQLIVLVENQHYDITGAVKQAIIR